MRRGQLRVLDPCSEDYEAMDGAGPTRFCDNCSEHVHNLSEMTRPQAEAFLVEHAGESICVRYRASRAGEISFRPGLVAAMALTMAACTGYLEDDGLESPEDTVAVAGLEVVPYADEGLPGPDLGPVPDSVPAAEDQEFRGDIDLGAYPHVEDEDEVEDDGEGCPIRRHGEYDEDEVIMGRMESPRALRHSGRLARRQRRWDRREARRLRRAAR